LTGLDEHMGEKGTRLVRKLTLNSERGEYDLRGPRGSGREEKERDVECKTPRKEEGNTIGLGGVEVNMRM